MAGELKAKAHEWAILLKLGSGIRSLIDTMDIAAVYRCWRERLEDKVPTGMQIVPLGDGIHGVTRIRGGAVKGIEIASGDPKSRQLVTIVHEKLHAEAHPNQPDHESLHTLAAGLATKVFPSYYQRREIMYTDKELAAMKGIEDEFDRDDELVVSTDEEDEGIISTDEDDSEYEFDVELFRRKKKGKKKKKSSQQQVEQQLLGENRKPSGLEGIAAVQRYQGWLMPHIIYCYENKTMIAPMEGIAHAEVVHNIGGYRAPTFAAWWEQLIQSLNAGATRADFGENAVVASAGVDSVVALTVSSIGAIMSITDSELFADQRDVRVRHFSQVGATELEYFVVPKPRTGAMRWLCLGVTNDRGSGLPVTRADNAVTIPMDRVRPGAVIRVKSANYRDVER